MESVREKYARTTRETLLAAARRLFGEHEYADVSAEEVVRAAGLTRGALYHHFDGKRGLFEAVFEEVEEAAAARIAAALEPVADPFEQAVVGATTFLELCAEGSYRHIVLLQGPIALGWQRCLELDRQYLGGLLLQTAQRLLDERLVKRHPAELLASAFYGVLTDLALTVAAAPDPQRTRRQATSLVRDLLTGLRVG